MADQLLQPVGPILLDPGQVGALGGVAGVLLAVWHLFLQEDGVKLEHVLQYSTLMRYSAWIGERDTSNNIHKGTLQYVYPLD